MTTPRRIDFSFKKFSVAHDRCAMKVGTDAVLLGSWADPENTADTILDVGTGCGIIALMIAQRNCRGMVDAIEPDVHAAEQAMENVAHSPFPERINIFKSPLQNFLPDKKYDLMVTNPPYFENSLLSADQRKNSVRHTLHLQFEDIFQFATTFLHEDGSVSMILPYSVKDKIIRIAENYFFFPNSICNVKSHKEKMPVRLLISFGKNRKIADENELIMFIKDREPTPEYRKLTSDFYLHF